MREDGQSVIALTGLAATYSIERGDPADHLTPEQLAEHERVVNRALKLAPDDSTALMLWGNMQLMNGRVELALPALEKANRLVPSYSNGYLLVAQALLMLGRTDEVQATADRVVDLGASDARRVSGAYDVAAQAALMLGDDARGYDLARRGVATLPSSAYAHGTLAAADALTGRHEEAATELSALLKLWPTATVADYDHLRRSTHPIYLLQRARLYEGLRKAGLPER